MASIQQEHNQPERSWFAQLSLEFELKKEKSILSRVSHQGPLRVQKPFYPEVDGTCHLYILHPPGGMVVGDQLGIQCDLKPGARALLTTPSAGKIYGVNNLKQKQTQNFDFAVGDGSVLEWLPQENIVFSGANGKLKTRVELDENGKVFVWDIVRLGRSASGETFDKGECSQSLEIWRQHKPLFIERNIFTAGSDLQSAAWGLRGVNTSATLCTNIQTTRIMIDEWIDALNHMSQSNQCLWGLSQKKEFFIARYLGDSVTSCRKGFEYLWQQCRPLLIQKTSVVPRIWYT